MQNLNLISINIISEFLYYFYLVYILYYWQKANYEFPLINKWGVLLFQRLYVKQFRNLLLRTLIKCWITATDYWFLKLIWPHHENQHFTIIWAIHLYILWIQTFSMSWNDKVLCFHQHGRSAEKLNKKGTSSSQALEDNLTRTARTSTL